MPDSESELEAREAGQPRAWPEPLGRDSLCALSGLLACPCLLLLAPISGFLPSRRRGLGKIFHYWETKQRHGSHHQVMS